MSQIEWKTTEIRASKVGNVSPFSCPGADNVKIVVVAPNIDEGSTLAQSVDEILQAALEMDVPVVFALGKRKLGKALKKSVGVSAVGIYSGDGAHDEYRAVTNRLRDLQKDPTIAVDPASLHNNRRKQQQPPRPADAASDAASDMASAGSAPRPPVATPAR